jgi:hypothetical protein
VRDQVVAIYIGPFIAQVIAPLVLTRMAGSRRRKQPSGMVP